MKILQTTGHVMMRAMARVMPSCKEISEQISQALDRQLPLRRRLSIRLHVTMCSFCRRYEKQLRLLRHGFTSYADPEKNMSERSLSPEARAKLKKAIGDCSKQ